MTFRRRASLDLLGTACLLLLASQARGATPSTLTEQGRLFDGAGAPLDGTVALRFSIYSGPTGGAPLWTEVDQVTLADGYFSLAIGTVAPLPATLWDGSVRYVGV